LNSTIDNEKKCYSFPLIYCALFVICLFALDANIEEDSIYVSQAESMVHDLDYNILDQVDREFGWIITKTLKHPSQHSVIQTPSIILSSLPEIALSYFFKNHTLKKYVLTGIFLNIISLIIAFCYCRKLFALFNIGFSLLEYLFFIGSTVTLYYCYFSLTVIEIFTFPISSFLLFSLYDIKINGNNNDNNTKFFSFSLGCAAALLLISKMSYIPLFLLTVFTIFSKNLKRKSLFIFLFLVGVLFIVTPSLLNMYIQYGSIKLLNASLTQIVCDYSFFNVYHTFVHGYFGLGGFFYTTPIFFPIFLMLAKHFFYNIFKIRKDIVFNLILFSWLGMSYFQTVFIVGPIVDDHYVGRLTLTALPLLVFGYLLLIKQVNTKRRTFLFVGTGLICWQLFTIFNFLNLYKTSQYAYASNKLSPSVTSFVKTIYQKISFCFSSFMSNPIYLLIYVLIISLIIYILLRQQLEIASFFPKAIVLISTILFLFSLFNFNYSDNNSDIFFQRSENHMDRVIVDDASLYFYNYAIDMLKSQYLNSKSKRMRSLIQKTRIRYFDSLKGKAIKTTPQFETALDNYNFNYGYFYDLKDNHEQIPKL
jgi:hypothetical protein